MLNVATSREIVASKVSFNGGVIPAATSRTRILKPDEEKRLLENSPLLLRRLLVVAMETALSRGDLPRLEWDDVDYENGVIVPKGG
jgi:integrase